MAKTPIKTKAKDSDSKPDKEPKDSGAKRSLSDVFKKTPAGGGFSFPPGKYKANVTEFELIYNEKGISAKITYTGHEDEDEGVAGKKLSQFYKLQDAEGEPGAGIGFLKADLEKLGHADPDFDDLEDVFREISREEPLVEIQVKQNGAYTNAYLNGVVEE